MEDKVLRTSDFRLSLSNVEWEQWKIFTTAFFFEHATSRDSANQSRFHANPSLPILLEIVLAGLLCPEACAASTDFDEARRQQDAGHYVEAEKLYRAVLRAQPKSVPALTNLGVVLAKQRKYGEAVTAYKNVLRLAPDLLPVRINLGIAFYQAEQYAEAADWFQSVLKVSPREAKAQHLLAICYLQTNRYQQAADLFSKLLPSEDVSLNVGAATAFLKTGRQAEAEELFAKTLKGRISRPRSI